MPAYVIADIDVQDAEKFEEYKRTAAATSAPFGQQIVPPAI